MVLSYGVRVPRTAGPKNILRRLLIALQGYA
jgi:hypothetical protein